MSFFDFDSLTAQLAGPFGYLGVFGLLLACGMGVPIPEDIILISGGYIAFAGGHTPWVMMCFGLLGILGGDSIIYWIGRHFGLPFAQRSFLRRYLTTPRLEKVRVLFRSHGEKMIMGARFMPGVRAVTFFTAGTMRVPYYHFVFFDGLAALISAPLWVFLGFKFGHRVVHWAHQFQGALLIVAFLLGVLLLVLKLSHDRKRGDDLHTPPLPLPPE